mmetsp:Transcript_29997/g.45144  ORF Transcript_29997/g.45144 Transcript_29997/m.45144 type:complete len:398 (-) Transcript_29997:75-1268(-)
MKTGLLLLQSIATSTRGCRTVLPTALSTFQTYAFASSSSSSSTCHTKVGAAAYAAAGLIGGTSTVVLCSNDDGSNNSSSSNIKKAIPVRKSIDDPLHILQHNPSLPFPESSIKHDTYNGVTLDVTKVPQLSDASATDSSTFGEMLSNALNIWSDEGRRGIWLRIPTSHAHLIGSATKLGFDFQHAEPGTCVLTKWLPKDSESRLPNGPSHQVGVGVLVLHPLTGKMLAVQERTGPAAARKLWKMPTGLTDPGEDIAAAAIRELKEETGLDVEFDKIICFRQAHGGLFNRSDMFFVCLCKLAPKYETLVKQGGEIELLPQEEEILCADWIDMEDYAVQGVWTQSPLYKEMNRAMIDAARKGIEYSSSEDGDEAHGFVSKVLPVGFRPGSNAIYVSSKL